MAAARIVPERIDRRELEHELRAAADAEKAANLAWFFKTGKGQYGEGDCFLGITVPRLRKIALRYRLLSLKETACLLKSPIHEHRLAALEILVSQYERGTEAIRGAIFEFYLTHTAGINNWDLVDASAPYIVGKHLCTQSRRILDELAASENLWERRIAIISTLALIKQGEIDDTFRIAQKLLPDRHDLIHKAVGWALRETGKVSRTRLLQFLKRNYSSMPRATLRYAIEHLPDERRKRILAGDFG